jgi:hypothetical protein
MAAARQRADTRKERSAARLPLGAEPQILPLLNGHPLKWTIACVARKCVRQGRAGTEIGLAGKNGVGEARVSLGPNLPSARVGG